MSFENKENSAERAGLTENGADLSPADAVSTDNISSSDTFVNPENLTPSQRRDLVDPYFLDKQEQDEVFALLEEMNRERDILFNQNEEEIKSPHPSCSLCSQSTLSDLGEGYRLQFINSISKMIIVFKFYVYMLAEE